NITAVVKRRDSQAFLNWDRNAEFGVDDEKFASAIGYLNLSARRSVVRIAAHGNISLFACAVQRKAAQCAPATRKEQLAFWHATAGERLGKPDAQAVGPHDAVANLLVISDLRTQAREVDA